MAMTVNKPHKILGEMIAAGHGRRPVNVAKHTFTHNCESDGATNRFESIVRYTD